jgi:hypothetical protein
MIQVVGEIGVWVSQSTGTRVLQPIFVEDPDTGSFFTLSTGEVLTRGQTYVEPAE